MTNVDLWVALAVATGVTLALALVAFWIWMLIDCLTRESKAGQDRLVWALVIVVTQAWLWVSTDDLATVYVNGTLIGTVGSITNPSVSTMAQNALTRFNIAAALKGGRNTVAVVGQNGPPSFGPCAVACSYAQNPAGTVLGGYVKYVLPRKP